MQSGMLARRMMSITQKRRWLLTFFLAGLILATCAAAVFWRASRAVKESAAQLAAQGEIRFTVTRLDRPVSSGFEPLSAPAVFTGAHLLGSRLYLSGPSGLFVYDTRGVLVARYLVGR